jgi:hypothetical protein
MPPTTQLTHEQQAALRAVLVETVDGSRRRQHGISRHGISRHVIGRRGIGRHVIGRRGGLAILGSGVLTAGVVAVALVAPGPPAARPAESAPAMLRTAADTIRSQPVVRPGQYLVVTTHANYLGILGAADGEDIGYVAPEVLETFIPYDKKPQGEVRRTTYTEPTVFYGAGAREFAATDWEGRDHPVVVQRGRPSIRQLGGGTEPAPTDPDTLPLDPGKLLAFLRTSELPPGGVPDENAFERAAEILRVGDVKSNVQAALYRALALLPSVTVIGHTTALDGTEGIAFALSTVSGDSRQEIIIDPAGGEYVGERQVAVKGFGAFPAGTDMESTSVTLSVADEAP